MEQTREEWCDACQTRLAINGFDICQTCLQMYSTSLNERRCPHCMALMIDSTCMFCDMQSNQDVLFERAIKVSQLDIISKMPIQVLKYKLDDLCAVCIESFQKNDNVMILPCTHMFHAACITPWLQKKLNCPLCFQEVCSQVETNDSEK